ncbi:MAG: hypothetical protein A2Y33_08835 [Spirochaetes bacterium GWF1_51_8]|nr:MAG: hypothetical protein A2Y33_08835 [Spirochaetes bacterium GWF1_51_8]
MKKICVFGTGGVGGYFGGKIASRLNDREVYFIARGEHLEQIRKNGLILNTASEKGLVCRPALATDNPAEIPQCDLVLLSVKSYDLKDCLPHVKRVAGAVGAILPLLNGVDIVERIRNVVDTAVVLPGCVYVGTHISKPGEITQDGGDGRIIFGDDPLGLRYDPAPLIELFRAAGIAHEYQPDPYPSIWMKYIFIAAYGMVTAAYRKTLDEVYADNKLRTLALSVMHEIAAIAERKGVGLPENAAASSLDKAKSFPAGTKTSFQRDYEKGGKNESDLFGGTIIRLGRETGIPTPFTNQVFVRL